MKKYKIFSWVSIAVAVAVFILLNVFMSMLTSKLPIKIDLTTNKIYELTDASKDFLKSYDKDTTIYIIASQKKQDGSVRAVLDRYAAANSRIKLVNIDARENMTFGRKYVSDGETLGLNDLVVECGDRFRIIPAADLSAETADGSEGLNVEAKITSALKQVTGPKLKAYFSSGNKESEFAAAAQALENEGYETKYLDLMTSDIPEDAAVFITALPQADFSEAEIAKLDAYLRNGGSLQVYVDAKTPELKNLNAYLKSNGIEIAEAEVVAGQNNVIPSSEGNSYIFTASYSRYLWYVPFAKPIDTAETAGNIKVEAKLTSGAGSGWRSIESGETELGERNLALMSTNSETGAMIYVCGTPMLFDMFSLADIDAQGLDNTKYLVDTTNSMSDAGDSFVVPVKSVSADQMSISEAAADVYGFIIIILIPALVLAVGLAVFFKRRNM